MVLTRSHAQSGRPSSSCVAQQFAEGRVAAPHHAPRTVVDLLDQGVWDNPFLLFLLLGIHQDIAPVRSFSVDFLGVCISAVLRRWHSEAMMEGKSRITATCCGNPPQNLRRSGSKFGEGGEAEDAILLVLFSEADTNRYLE